MKINTHGKTDQSLCGTPLELKEGFARVALKTTPAMAADEQGLVHGGFIFGLADYAAMLAVNEANVVLAEANVRFLKPVQIEDNLVAEAKLIHQEKNKAKVRTEVRKNGELIFVGDFLAVIPKQHVLKSIQP